MSTDKTTATEAIALARAKARTSPPKRASVVAYDRLMAERIIKSLEAGGWRISHVAE